MAAIDKLFSLMVEKDASDLHMSAGLPPCLRISGDLVWLKAQPLTHETNKKLFFEILTDRGKKQLEQEWQADFVYNMPDGRARFRSNVYMQQRGISGAFRLIPNSIIPVEDLGLPPSVPGLTKLKRGMIVVTGPTGSGKSTTLASLIDMVNQNRCDHILTVEDPIEFVHTPKGCLISQRQVGEHVNSFADALRAALREDPDVILVGEMRDLETIQLALTAAETGHLVFGTLHTNSAPKTVDRIIDAFPSNQQEQIRVMLAESLKAVVAQNLIKRSDGKGRVAAFEVLIGSPALSNIIRERKTPQISSMIQTGKTLGMQLMDQSLMDLVKQKKISAQVAMDYAVDKKMFTSELGVGSAAPATGSFPTNPSGRR
jgi:twitching motility protein PilT